MSDIEEDYDMDNMNKREYTEKEKELLAELEAKGEYDSELDSIFCEFRAIELHFDLGDKRVLKLIKPFRKAVDYIESHSRLTREEILQRVNNVIQYIEIVKEYKDDPTGVGYVDGLFGGLSLREDVLDDEEYLYKFIRHEMTHMMGERYVKKVLNNRPIKISGYSAEDVYSKKKEAPNENEYFNESVVEMFIAQDNEYEKIDVLGYEIHTNQENDDGLYTINGNLIRQMIIARGIAEEELFNGLFDYNYSKDIIKRINRVPILGPFKKISKNMDDIFNGVLDVYDKLDKNEDDSKEKGILDEKISQTERIIIDRLLCPSIRNLDETERQQLLSRYYPFIISEKEYFISKTNFRPRITNGESTNVIEHIDVPPLEGIGSEKNRENSNNRKKDNRYGIIKNIDLQNKKFKLLIPRSTKETKNITKIL